MIFCVNMYLDNLYNPIEYQRHRSKVKVTSVLLLIFCVHYAVATHRQYLASLVVLCCRWIVQVLRACCKL